MSDLKGYMAYLRFIYDGIKVLNEGFRVWKGLCLV